MINVEAHDRPLRELAVRNFHEKILSRCLDALAMRLSTWEPKRFNACQVMPRFVNPLFGHS